MRASLPIGDFSRATHLSVKTLRHYHRVGLLEPADVDPDTGHRRYTTDQIPAAQVIRRFRALDMPLDDIRAVITTPDLASANELIAGASEPAGGHALPARRKRPRRCASCCSRRRPLPADDRAPQVPAAPAAAVRQVIDIEDASAWYQGAVGELYATLAAQKLAPAGPGRRHLRHRPVRARTGRGHRLRALRRSPCGPPAGSSRSSFPPPSSAITVHAGPAVRHRPGLRIARRPTWPSHALGVDGPIREYYAVGSRDTADETQWRTEIGWPIFRTGPAPATQPLAGLTGPRLPELEPVPFRIGRPAEPAVRRLLGLIRDLAPARRSWASIAARSSTR